jgi:hypothetical protein
MAELENDPIVASKDAHEIGKHFYDIQQQFIPVPESNYGVYLIRKDYFPGTPQAFTAADYYAQDFSGDLKKQYYVRFGRFLDFLVEKIIPNINYDPNIKLIKIDTNVKSNIIHVLPRIVSADPKVCCIQSTFVTNGKTYFYAPYCSEFLIPFESNIKGKYGYVMNIYFNFNFILAKIDELKDDKGKISLYSLLDALCKGFNEATGHYNRLEPIIDSEENIIKILDDVALPDRRAILKSPLLSGSFGDELTENVIFDTYGYYTGTVDSIYGSGVPHAGFIKDLSFTTTVSPELATMITVGSTNKGYVKGQDATALSRMNNGLEDRFKKEITNTNEVKDEAPPPLEVEYKASIEAFNLYIQNLGVSEPGGEPTYDEKAVTNYKNTQTQFVEYQQAQATQEEKRQHPESTAASPNAGFLPFDLSLTMDGLSGMKVYQSFLMDTTFLPTNYPGTLEFLIKGITHKIEGNQWTTNIESMAIPKNPFAVSGSDNPVDEASRNSNRGEGKFVAKTSTGGSTPNADALRAVIKSLGYTEKGKEISNGGDITPELVKYASSVLREIKKQLPNLQVKITGGNDKYHQGLSYKSSHSTGQGLDIAITPANTANKNIVDTILGGFAAGNQNSIVSFINEYDYPSNAATGGHFHIRIGGKIESKRIPSFIALAKQGKLITYPIV